MDFESFVKPSTNPGCRSLSTALSSVLCTIHWRRQSRLLNTTQLILPFNYLTPCLASLPTIDVFYSHQDDGATSFKPRKVVHVTQVANKHYMLRAAHQAQAKGLEVLIVKCRDQLQTSADFTSSRLAAVQ